MKKLIAVIAALTLALCGCSSGAADNGTGLAIDVPEGYTGPGTAIAEAYLPDDECFSVTYPGADGNPVESFFSVDELVWEPYVPSEG